MHAHQNPLTIDPHIITEFTCAVNSARLCTLWICYNFLGDSFAQVFLSQLSSPYLRKLDLSDIDMTDAIVSTLAEYVGSSRCLLDHLLCNDNNMSVTGVRKIVDAIMEKNYSLWNVRFFYHLPADPEDWYTIAPGALLDCNLAMSDVQSRNKDVMDRVRYQSLALLRYSRALFLRSGTARASQSDTPFFRLPAELQQEILPYLAPSLSHQQRMRIVCFASDAATLKFSSHRRSHGTAQQLEAHATSLDTISPGQPCQGKWRPPAWWECHCPSNRQRCECFQRWKKDMRDMWWIQVACTAYERPAVL